MQPIMAVWDGEVTFYGHYIYGSKSSTGFALGGTSVAESGLDPYIQQAIDQVGQLFPKVFYLINIFFVILDQLRHWGSH
jgi:hypothetical protein